MTIGEYSGVAGMKAGSDYQELLSQNLALQAVPGYREVIPVFSTDTTIGKASDSSPLGHAASVKMSRVTDFSQGSLAPSGSPYHLAIQGQSFFEVRDPGGATTYTRNGEFTLSREGELQTSDGATVLGSGDSPLTVDTSKSSQVNFASDGTLSVGGVTQGQLELAYFDNPSTTLEASANGRFVANSTGQAQTGLAPGDKVMQGFLEQSNGNPVMEMANMIQAMRFYEANQKTIQSNDDSQSKLISNLGSRAA